MNNTSVIDNGQPDPRETQVWRAKNGGSLQILGKALTRGNFRVSNGEVNAEYYIESGLWEFAGVATSAGLLLLEEQRIDEEGELCQKGQVWTVLWIFWGNGCPFVRLSKDGVSTILRAADVAGWPKVTKPAEPPAPIAGPVPTHRCPKCRAITIFTREGAPQTDAMRCMTCKGVTPAAEIIRLPDAPTVHPGAEVHAILQADGKATPAFAAARTAAVIALMEEANGKPRTLTAGQVRCLLAAFHAFEAARGGDTMPRPEAWSDAGQALFTAAGKEGAAFALPSFPVLGAFHKYERVRSR